MKRPSRPAILLGTIAVLLALPAAQSATLSWDLNGATANTTVPVTGTWDGTNLFWNDSATGTGGTPRAGTTNADDLIFSSGSSYTAGTVTLSGARVASSITFEDNIAVTLSGGTSLTLGGSGTKSGVFVLPGDNQSNTLSTPIILDSSTSALTFSNAGTGLLTFSTGTITGSAAGTQTINLASTSSGGIKLAGNIGDGTGGGSVALNVNSSGSGVTILTGTNTYTGTTTIAGGTLMARNASALGTGSVTVGSSAALLYTATVDAPLSIGGTLGITGGTGTVLGGSIGATPTSARINVAGAATIGNAAHKVNIYGITGVTPVTGTYTLLQGGAGSSLNPATAPTLNLVYNNTNFTVGALSRDVDHLYADITSVAPLTTAYWKGGLTGGTAVWAASNGSTQSNWVTTSGGANQALVPGAGTDVIFSNSTVTTSPNPTTLGADMTIRSLTQQSSSRSVTLQADGFSLTISPSDPTTGITINSGATSVSLRTNVILGASQTWSNNDYRPLGGSAILGVSGAVFNGTNLLTVGGTGDSSISGTIGNGSGGLTKTGRGTLTLSGANTYTGATEINGGTLTLSGAAGALNASTVVTLSNNATLALSNTSTQSAVNRLRDSMDLTSHGGTVSYSNTSGSGLTYFETTGTVTLTNGQLNVILSTNMTGGTGNRQTLTISGLTRTGSANTATVSFSAPVLDSTTNRIRVTGAAQTPAGQIIGPWATVSPGNVVQTDYAVYDPSGYVLPAGIAHSAETTWTNAANAYTMSGDTTLTTTRTITALLDASVSGLPSLRLGAFNLETFGILGGSTSPNSTLKITSSGGVVRQPGTGSANLYVTTGIGGISIAAPIQDNGGALTLVKAGGDNSYSYGAGPGLTLSGENTFSGGVVLNAGRLTLSSATALGTGTLTICGGATIFSEWVNLALTNNNPVILNGDFAFGDIYGFRQNNLNLGTGTISLGTTPGTVRKVSVFSGALTLGGVISDGSTATSLNLYNVDDTQNYGTGTLILSGANTYTGGTVISVGMLMARNGSALGSGNVTVASGQALNYAASTDSPLALRGKLSLTAGTNVNTGTPTLIGGSLGSSVASAAITVAGVASAAVATSGANPAVIGVNVYPIGGFAPLPGTNSYTLIHGAAGSSLNNATYSINQVYNNTNFTVGSPAATATDLMIPVTSATPLATAYWIGGLSGADSTWAVSSGSASNWASTSGGPVQALVPGANTDVVVVNSNFGYFPTLGANMNIRGLTFSSGAYVEVQPDTSSSQLTIGSGGVTKNAGSSQTRIAPDVILGASQTWKNNSNNGSLYFRKVINGGNLLTIADNSSSTSINIYGPISGSGGLTMSGNGILTLGGLSTYTGLTTINSGRLMLWGSPGVLGIDPTGSSWNNYPGGYPVGSITQSSGIVLNGGGLDIINKTTDTAVDRIGDNIPITAKAGWYISIANTAGSGVVYNETIGTVALTGGELLVVFNNDMNGGGGNSQTLTLSGLTHAGSSNTASVVFADWVTGPPNTTTNRMRVTGATQTPAGQIIGPWATVGRNPFAPADYAVFDGATNIIPAAIPASAETAWTNFASAYTMSGDQTLTATRNFTALRCSATATLSLGVNNLETSGILKNGTGTLTINSASGVIRQQGTSAAALYVTAGDGSINIAASIQDNTGPLTLVKSGSTVTLSAANTYTGATVINSGLLQISHNLALQNSVFNTASKGILAFSTGINTPTFGGLIGSVNLTLPAGVTSLTLNPGTGAAPEYSGALGGTPQSMALTKTGGGMQILSGNNTYTGPTTINGGELRVTGSIATSSLTTVVSGVLSGTGTVGALRAAGGTLAPGTSAGTLNSGSVDFSGGTLVVELASASLADRLNVTGTAGLSADTALAISLLGGYDPQVGDNWVLLQNDGADAFGMGAFHFTSGNAPILDNTPFTIGDKTFVLEYNAGTGNDVVLTAVVPEPTTGVILLAGLPLLLRRRRGATTARGSAGGFR